MQAAPWFAKPWTLFIIHLCPVFPGSKPPKYLICNIGYNDNDNNMRSDKYSDFAKSHLTQNRLSTQMLS